MYNPKLKALSLIVIGMMLLSAFISRPVDATTIQSTDFQQQSFSKVVDWFDYVRQYAAANGYPAPNSSEHAFLYTNYINVNGFQLFYVGLVNATHLGKFVTIPLQTFFEHYKTLGGGTVITASSFISLVAFQENSSTIFPNSPDRNDTLYASLSLGYNLTAFAGRSAPSYLATSQIIPLTSTGNLHWSWGLKYTNLNAIWWRIGVNPLYPFWDPVYPRGLARYSELTFTYDLTIDPATKTAKLVTSYTIGKVTDLWLFTQIPVKHLNATGTYDLAGALISSQTVYDFLRYSGGGYKLSLVLSHKSILAQRTVTDKDDAGNSVDDSEHDESRAGVDTNSDIGERVFRADFGVKHTYQLYNMSDTTSTPYNVTTRTVRRAGWGGNPVFAFQNRFMGFLPLFVAHVDPALLQQAKTGMVSFATSDYLFTISYPRWGGWRIVHDPNFTAFYQPSNSLAALTAIFIVVVVAAAVGGTIAFLVRRKRTSVAIASSPSQAPPGQTPPGPPGPSTPGR